MNPYDAAMYVKERVETTSQEEEANFPYSDWSERRHSGFCDVPYAHLASFSDKEHDRFLKINDERVRHVCDTQSRLKEWISTSSVEEIAERIATTISGMDGDDKNPPVEFTPFQRLLVSVYDKFPVTCSSSVFISTENVRDLARAPPGSGCRAMPIEAKRCLMEGSSIDFAIFNGPTASGKTAMSICMASQLVRSARFPLLMKEYREKRLGTVFSGVPDLLVARLVVVATGASVFQHFVSTITRLKRNIESSCGARVVVWDKIGKNCSVQIAASLVDTIVFWVVPTKKLVDVLRCDPDIAIACVVTDEFTVEPPRERILSRQSHVCKHVVPIATPQDLVHASSGRTFLQKYFGGNIIGPYQIPRMIASRAYTDAQRTADQLCLFDLCTYTAFRPWLRKDLESLVPSRLRVISVKSRRATLSSHLLQSDTDLLPASPENVIFSMLNTNAVTEASVTRIQDAFSGDTVDMKRLVSSLNEAEFSASSLHYQRENFKEKRDRIVARLTEFEAECPICATEEGQSFRIFKCCGYVVCDNCFSRVSSSCYFCRMQVEHYVPRSSVPVRGEANAPPPSEGDDLSTDILSSVAESSTQLTNLVTVFEKMYNYGLKRILLVVNCDTNIHDREEAKYEVLNALSEKGFSPTVVDNLLSGKGSAFTSYKSVFDSDDPRTMVMTSFTMDQKLLTGTNLDRVDAFVTVGTIPRATLTQAVGRIFRPLAARDNTKPFPFVRIFS